MWPDVGIKFSHKLQKSCKKVTTGGFKLEGMFFKKAQKSPNILNTFKRNLSPRTFINCLIPSHWSQLSLGKVTKINKKLPKK